MCVPHKMTKPNQTIDWEGEKFSVTWIKTNSLKGITPITQVYGVCFNDKEQILIARRVGRENWAIPGGHPEKNETIEETLKREFIEEVDVKIKNIRLLGVQKVYPENKPKEYFYQVRCICEVDEMLPQTPDLDNGENWERKFVPSNEITKYVKWGITGDTMFKDAISLHEEY